MHGTELAWLQCKKNDKIKWQKNTFELWCYIPWFWLVVSDFCFGWRKCHFGALKITKKYSLLLWDFILFDLQYLSNIWKYSLLIVSFSKRLFSFDLAFDLQIASHPLQAATLLHRGGILDMLFLLLLCQLQNIISRNTPSISSKLLAP